jgi:hypothetical protein
MGTADLFLLILFEDINERLIKLYALIKHKAYGSQ